MFFTVRLGTDGWYCATKGKMVFPLEGFCWSASFLFSKCISERVRVIKFCGYPLSLRCFWNSSSRFWKFSFELFNLFWVIGGQLIENQPLLRQIYKEPPILSRDNLAKKKENVMSVTGHRSKVMKKQALCQNGKMHIATNSPYFGLQDKASSGPIKKNNKTKN